MAATEETLRLIIQTELKNALTEMQEFNEELFKFGEKVKQGSEKAKGLSEFEKAFSRFKEEATRAKSIQEDFNKALAQTPDDQALKDFGKSMKFMGEEAKSTTQVVGDLVAALGLVQGARAALDFGKEMAAAWGEQEAAVTRLNASLKVQGRSLESAGLQKFAGDLQKATGQGDELTVALLGNFAALQRTTPQLKSMAKAAADLAAGSGISYQQAMEALNLTLDGQARGLASTVPAVRELTEEQLKNGEAIKLVADLYQGQAAIAMSNLQGKLSALTGEFGDMQESLFDDFAPMIKSLVDMAREIVAFITEMPAPVRGAVVALGALTAAGIGVVGALTAFQVMKPALLATFAQLTGGATTFWAAMTGPLGWGIAIAAGLAVVVGAVISATNAAREESERFANDMANAGTDVTSRMRIANTEAIRLKKTIQDMEELPANPRYRRVREQRIAEAKEELKLTEALILALNDRKKTEDSIAASDRVWKEFQDNRKKYTEALTGSISILDRYKSDLQKKQEEIAAVEAKFQELAKQRDTNKTLNETELKGLQAKINELAVVKARLLAELQKAETEAGKTPFDKALEAYQAGLQELANKVSNIGLKEDKFLELRRNLAAQFVETVGGLKNLTDIQKAKLNEILSISLEPEVKVSAFDQSFKQWKDAQREAAVAKQAWKEALDTSDMNQYEALVRYGDAMGYFAEETDEAALAFKELSSALQDAFGDLGVIGAAVVKALVPPDVQGELKKHLTQYAEEYKAVFSSVSALAQDLSAVIMEAQTAALENEVGNLEKQLEAHDSTTQKQIEAREALGKDTVTFELAAAADREKIEKDLAKKKAELEIKQFRMDQIQRSGQAAMASAVEAAKVLSNPFALGAVIAAGLGQQAIIWSQQPPAVPAFYDGGIIPGSASGILARIGERSQSEMVLPLRAEKLKELGLSGGGGFTVGSVSVYSTTGDPRTITDGILQELQWRHRNGELDQIFINA